MQEKMERNIPYFDVSRETLAKLERYAELVVIENKTHNLISKTTEEQIWERHILDSAQIYPFVQRAKRVVDMGSGAGFPGIVMSILGIKDISLIESRGKKANFLQKVASDLSLDCKIVCGRVEEYNLLPQTVVISRAFAPLVRTLSYLQSGINNVEKMVLLKGENYQNEIDDLKKFWTFETKFHISKTNKAGKVIEISGIKNANNSNCKPERRRR